MLQLVYHGFWHFLNRPQITASELRFYFRQKIVRNMYFEVDVFGRHLFIPPGLIKQNGVLIIFKVFILSFKRPNNSFDLIILKGINNFSKRPIYSKRIRTIIKVSIIFVAASHQTGLDARSMTQRPIIVGI